MPLLPLRMRNLFDPNNQTNIPSFNPNLTTPDFSPQPQPQMPESNDISSRMRQLYNPESSASDRLNKTIDEYPTHDNPSIMRRIGASLAGVGYGPEAGQEILDSPFKEKLVDWKNKIQPIENAATLEKSNNTNERMAAHQIIADQLSREAEQHRVEKNERDAKIKEDRAAVYRMKAEDPNYKFDFKGPTVIRTDKQGNVLDTKISTGSLSDTDKLEMSQTNALERIGATGEQNRQTEETRQTGRETLKEQGAWKIYNVPDETDPTKQKAVQINEYTGEVRPVKIQGGVNKPSGLGSQAKPELPSQTKTKRLNKVNQALIEHPEWAKYIHKQGTNDFKIDPPSSGGMLSSGPDQVTHKAISDYIFGSSNTNESNKPIEKTIPGTDKIAISTDGGKTWKAK